MAKSSLPAAKSPPFQLRFPSIPGFTVRADFAGGELSSDLGAVVLGAVDRRIGLIDRFAAAIILETSVDRLPRCVTWRF